MYTEAVIGETLVFEIIMLVTAEFTPAPTVTRVDPEVDMFFAA
jgi:hypothetical protein